MKRLEKSGLLDDTIDIFIGALSADEAFIRILFIAHYLK
jgi:hypothetical protein